MEEPLIFESAINPMGSHLDALRIFVNLVPGIKTSNHDLCALTMTF